MNDLKDIMFEIIRQYPTKKDMSNARLTKLIYLVDWHHVINHNQQATQIKWYFDNYGPYVSDIKETARKNDNLFDIVKDQNFCGEDKNVIYIKNTQYQSEISKYARDSIVHVINITKEMGWNKFIRLIYSTFPILTSERYSYLDLVEKVKFYKNFVLGPSMMEMEDESDN